MEARRTVFRSELSATQQQPEVQQVDYQQAYLPILQAYDAAMASDQPSDSPYVNPEAWGAKQYESSAPLSYAYVDIAHFCGVEVQVRGLAQLSYAYVPL